jgi:glycosyltransferase involved in cell wall biosynthesis
MKVAYLTGQYPRATDTFIQREVAALRAHGLEVVTCSIRRTDTQHLVGEEQRIEARATFHVLPATANPLTLFRAKLAALRHPARYFRALWLAWTTAPKGLRGRLYNLIYFSEALVLARHMARENITHLHNHIAKSSCTVAMLASALSDIPFSFTLHGPDIFFAPDHWRLDEKIARARFVACISNFARAQAMLFCDQGHWDKLKIIHCGVDPARYDTRGPRDGNHLLFIGRLDAVKGVPLLLEAQAQARATLPDLRLTLVGDGPDRAALLVQVQALNLNDAVDFAGYKSQSEVAALLAYSDCLVLPSFAEGVPVVLMEAMAARLPVIATRVGGTAELVEDGASGHLIAPGDAGALHDAILSVMADTERAAMGASGRARVQAEFDIQTEAARLAALFQAGAALPSETRPEARP